MLSSVVIMYIRSYFELSTGLRTGTCRQQLYTVLLSSLWSSVGENLVCIVVLNRFLPEHLKLHRGWPCAGLFYGRSSEKNELAS